MRTLPAMLATIALAAAPPALAQSSPKGKAPAKASSLSTDEEKTLYALGMRASGSFRIFQLSPAELAVVQRGLADGVQGKPAAVDMKVYGPRVDQLAARRTEAASKAAMAKWAKTPGAVALPSGLIYLSTKDGDGRQVGPDDVVKMHFEAKLPDGTVVDGSRKKGEPVDLPLARGIRCFQEGLVRMKTGGRAILVCPPALAYGDKGMAPSVPGGATLVFDVEVLSIPATIQAVTPDQVPGLAPAQGQGQAAPAQGTPAAPPAK